MQYLEYTIRKDSCKMPAERVAAITKYKTQIPLSTCNPPGNLQLLPQMNTARCPTSNFSQRTYSWAQEERHKENLVNPASWISLWDLRSQPCTSNLAFLSVSEPSTRGRNWRMRRLHWFHTGTEMYRPFEASWILLTDTYFNGNLVLHIRSGTTRHPRRSQILSIHAGRQRFRTSQQILKPWLMPSRRT
jgi:hypothetical protein